MLFLYKNTTQKKVITFHLWLHGIKMMRKVMHTPSLLVKYNVYDSPFCFLLRYIDCPPIVAYKSLFCLSLSYCFNSCLRVSFLSADLKVQWLTPPLPPTCICLWVLILFVFKVLLPLLLTCLLIVLFLKYIDSYIIYASPYFVYLYGTMTTAMVDYYTLSKDI